MTGVRTRVSRDANQLSRERHSWSRGTKVTQIWIIGRVPKKLILKNSSFRSWNTSYYSGIVKQLGLRHSKAAMLTKTS